MAWLLDTCVVSESFKSIPDAAVRQWLHAHRDQCLMPAVSVGEILFGIERMAPSARRSRLQLWCSSDAQTQNYQKCDPHHKRTVVKP